MTASPIPEKSIMGTAHSLTTKKAISILSLWVKNTEYIWKTSVTEPTKNAFSGFVVLFATKKRLSSAARKPARQVETAQATLV